MSAQSHRLPTGGRIDRDRVLTFSVDGVEWTGRPWLVAVANTHCYGGGMDIAPGAEVDNGLLDVIVVHDVSRPRVLRCFPRMIKGTHLSIDGVEHFRGTVVEIDGLTDQEIYASGERVGLLPATVDVWRLAARIGVRRGRARRCRRTGCRHSGKNDERCKPNSHPTLPFIRFRRFRIGRSWL